MKNITVEWTGKPFCLCSGEWIININGNPVELPECVKTSDMNTFGTYSRWHFNDDWSEEWDDYEDGLMLDEWLSENQWVKELNLTSEEEKELYDKIREQDWRHGSCGGCI